MNVVKQSSTQKELQPNSVLHRSESLFPCTWLNPKSETETFYFAELQHPVLVLWTPLSLNNTTDYSIWKNPKDWVKLYHQTAGYACMYMSIWARFLEPNLKIIELMDILARDWYESCIYPGTDLKTSNKYNSLLKRFKLSCNRSHNELQEGFYPIDIEYLNKATTEILPKNLKDLLVVDSNDLLAFLNRPRFGLAILTENCD